MNSEPHSTDAEPEQLVSEILTQFQAGGAYLRDHVERLATLTISDDRRVAQRASGAFFGSLVETLADSFEPAGVSLYNQAFAQLIQVCRNTGQGRPLDEEAEGIWSAIRSRRACSRGKPAHDVGAQPSLCG